MKDRTSKAVSQDTEEVVAEKATNYTPEQEAVIIAASPLNLESAKALAETMGKSYRSIIAKAKSLGLPYEVKPAPLKRKVQITKTQLVDVIAESLKVKNLSGLEKATTSALVALYNSLPEKVALPVVDSAE